MGRQQVGWGKWSARTRGAVLLTLSMVFLTLSAGGAYTVAERQIHQAEDTVLATSVARSDALAIAAAVTETRSDLAKYLATRASADFEQYEAVRNKAAAVAGRFAAESDDTATARGIEQATLSQLEAFDDVAGTGPAESGSVTGISDLLARVDPGTTALLDRLDRIERERDADLEHRLRAEEHARHQGPWLLVLAIAAASLIAGAAGLRSVRRVIAEMVGWRRDAEEDVAMRHERDRTVAAFAQRVFEGVDVREVLDDACATLAATLGTDMSGVVELDEAEGVVVLRSGVGWQRNIVGSSIPVHAELHPAFVLRSTDPVLTEDLQTEGRYRSPVLEAHRVRGALAVPLRGREVVHGFVGVYQFTPRAWSDVDVQFVTAIARLVTGALELRRMRDELRHQALHDPLTGLPNRTLLGDRLELAVARAARRGTHAAVLLLDVDRFKQVNDSLGHSAGDQLLIGVAERLQGLVRPGDTVARLGGDEFVVLCEDVNGAEAAIDLAQRITTSFGRPICLPEGEQFASVSVGVALTGAGHDDPTAILREADAAMYRAKERGRARYEIYDDMMRARAASKLRTETALRRAEHADELEVLFQPIVSLADGELVAAEALLRWNHPEHGLLTPKEFLVVAEESGLITEIGGWVLEQAVERTALWGLPIAVNLSVKQLCDPDMVDRVSAALHRFGARRELLWFDIPELALAASPVVTAALHALTRVGVRLAIDDFGAGSSSVFDLSGLPVAAVKLDAGVTARLPDDGEAVNAVRSTVALGHALGLQIVGEGVEQQAQLDVLRELGCDAAQGFHVAAPMAATAFEETWLRNRLSPGPSLPVVVDAAR